MIKAIILEDEISAQELLTDYIEKTSFIECLGVFESGLDIPLEILDKADLLFLDIQLPEINGLSFVKTLQNVPRIIVTSAYPDHALEAFEIAVADYLLKPFSYERFLKAVIRVRNQIKFKENVISLYADKIIHRIAIAEILYIKAEVDYVKFVTHTEEILVLGSLKNWEQKLSIYNFLQVHRSYIINLSKVKKIMSNKVFIEDHEIPVSKTYKKLLIDLRNF
jgi:DNA-binding LytR/AlgR family response regulator